MGLSVEIQDERHEIIAYPAVHDTQNILHRILEPVYSDQQSFPMLASIDAYGDTTFNRLQINRCLAEWERLSLRAVTPEDHTLLAAIADLAEKTRSDVHLYLVFIAD